MGYSSDATDEKPNDITAGLAFEQAAAGNLITALTAPRLPAVVSFAPGRWPIAIRKARNMIGNQALP